MGKKVRILANRYEIEKIAGGLCVTKTTAGCRPHGKRGY
jgi:hypothetical protein